MPKILSYSIETIKPDKTPAIWVMVEPNIMQPLCFLRKPKYLSDAAWQAVLGAIRFAAHPDLLDATQPEAGE